MSGGQRQAIAVARAVAFAKRVVILDEPTAVLGIRESRTVLNLAQRLPETGVSVIFISHNLDHVQQVADRAVVLRQAATLARPLPRRHTTNTSSRSSSVPQPMRNRRRRRLAFVVREG
jgi:D-xylose transport system ATP-binding protein